MTLNRLKVKDIIDKQIDILINVEFCITQNFFGLLEKGSPNFSIFELCEDKFNFLTSEGSKYRL